MGPRVVTIRWERILLVLVVAIVWGLAAAVIGVPSPISSLLGMAIGALVAILLPPFES